MAINKVVYGDQVLIDLTGDTVTADKLLSGFTAHGKDGSPIEGACTFDVNSQDATAAVAEILAGKTAYARGAMLTGTMPNNGSVSGEISTKDGQYSIPQGYHDGGGKVGIATGEKSKLIPGNIKSGITVLGVTGTYGGEAVKAQSNKNATPGMAQQIITPDEGFDYLAQVTVAPIPITYTDNAAGGQTLKVGA